MYNNTTIILQMKCNRLTNNNCINSYKQLELFYSSYVQVKIFYNDISLGVFTDNWSIISSVQHTRVTRLVRQLIIDTRTKQSIQTPLGSQLLRLEDVLSCCIAAGFSPKKNMWCSTRAKLLERTTNIINFFKIFLRIAWFLTTKKLLVFHLTECLFRFCPGKNLESHKLELYCKKHSYFDSKLYNSLTKNIQLVKNIKKFKFKLKKFIIEK